MEKHNMGSDRWLSVEEIANHLGVKKETIYKWLSQNRIPAHKVGRLWKFRKPEVDKWVTTGGAGRGERTRE